MIMSTKISFVAVLWLSLMAFPVTSQQDLSCDLLADLESCNARNNGVCDNDNGNESCAGLDCEDCDLCAQLYEYDCEGCMANGCWVSFCDCRLRKFMHAVSQNDALPQYCPADGICRYVS